jgi:hypothetical protein
LLELAGVFSRWFLMCAKFCRKASLLLLDDVKTVISSVRTGFLLKRLLGKQHI